MDLLKDLKGSDRIRVVEPQGYLDLISLQKNARMVLTDSGGIQKEALYLHTPCLTIRPETEWVETLEGGWNFLVEPNEEEILAHVKRDLPKTKPAKPYGEGQASQLIQEKITNFLE